MFKRRSQEYLGNITRIINKLFRGLSFSYNVKLFQNHQKTNLLRIITYSFRD